MVILLHNTILNPLTAADLITLLLNMVMVEWDNKGTLQLEVNNIPLQVANLLLLPLDNKVTHQLVVNKVILPPVVKVVIRMQVGNKVDTPLLAVNKVAILLLEVNKEDILLLVVSKAILLVVNKEVILL